MKKLAIIFFSLVVFNAVKSQTVTQKLQLAFRQFENDPQLKYAISSLYVIDAKTGQVIFDKNSRVGLAPASTQKIITSVTAFELLGKDYRYRTEFLTSAGNNPDLLIRPRGDPTLGSWRWQVTSIDTILKNLVISLDNHKINRIKNVLIDNSGWDTESIPDGWIWQDIGNYYGAGAHKLNYRENQYDIILKSGNKVGDSVSIIEVVPTEAGLLQSKLTSKLTSAPKGTGDNAYIYLPADNYSRYNIRGTIPVNENKFSISGSLAEPVWIFTTPLLLKLQDEKQFNVGHSGVRILKEASLTNDKFALRYTHYSPSLDSIIYWFNKKSVNLYGEALMKTFAYEKKGIGSTDSGIAIVKDFWKQKGLDPDELNIFDGSGLSPMNRVTTHAQVEILKYARKQGWFPYFLNSLPEYNGMTMKSGTIRNVKGFSGYHTAKNGKEYIFSFVVNNYNGSASALVNKMYKVLNVLK